MAVNQNPFALLGDDEDDDFTAGKYAQPPAAASPKSAAKASAPKKPQSQPAAVAKLPSKPLPPAESVRAEKESQAERGRGRGSVRRGGGRGDSFASGRGGGGGGYRNFSDSAEGEFHSRSYDGGGRGRGRRGGGFARGYDAEEKRGTTSAVEEPTPGNEEFKAAESKDVQPDAEQKKAEAPEDKEDKEMTLDEYEKILQEKRKNLGLQKSGERKVEADKELKKMQLVDKKSEDDIFIKLGSDKEKLKKKDSFEKEKKAMTINEFLRPAEGEKYSPRAGRGGGMRGRGSSGGRFSSVAAAAAAGADDGALSSIDNPQEFPQLGGGGKK